MQSSADCGKAWLNAPGPDGKPPDHVSRRLRGTCGAMITKIGKASPGDCPIASGVLLSRAVDLKIGLLPVSSPEILLGNKVMGPDDQEGIHATGLQFVHQLPHLDVDS